SNDYYPMFNRSNVELVTDPIHHIEANAIVTRDGIKRTTDALVLATGFSVWGRDSFTASGGGTASSFETSGNGKGISLTKASRSLVSQTCSTCPALTLIRGFHTSSRWNGR